MKQETGKTAIDLIHLFLISYALGFDNLPYFSKLFKKDVGISSNEFRFKYNGN
jgi:AraC family transcriptional regulator, transcriptional activator of pobA